MTATKEILASELCRKTTMNLIEDFKKINEPWKICIEEGGLIQNFGEEASKIFNNLTNIFHRQKDILVADSVLELFRKKDYIENFNKKALYIMIREMTGSNTQHITRVINQMKKYYFNMLQEFSADGRVDTSNTGSIFCQPVYF